MSAIIEHQRNGRRIGLGRCWGRHRMDVAPIVTELRIAPFEVYARKDLSIELVLAPASSL